MPGPTSTAVAKAKNEVYKMMEALAIRTLNIPGMTRAVHGVPGRRGPEVFSKAKKQICHVWRYNMIDI